MTETRELTGIVVAAQGGDPNAFNELYEVTAPDLKIVGYGILHNKEDVEDALQDTYMTIYRSFSAQGISPLQHPERFLPWAKQIMKNTCLNLIANRKRKAGKDELRPMNSGDDQLGMDRIDTPDGDLDFSPENVAEMKYVHELLDDALSDIPAIRKTCLALHQQGLTYREIGEKLNIPEGTAKSHVRYAKMHLQNSIKEIERKENVELHGIVFVQGPFGLKLMGQVRPKKSWITAEVSKDTPQKKVKRVLLSESGRKAIATFALAVLIAAVCVILSLVPQPLKEEPSAPEVKIVQDVQGSLKPKSGKSINKRVSIQTPDVENAASAEPAADQNDENEYYAPNITVKGRTVHFVPYHVWYQNGKLYVDSYVINSTGYRASDMTLFGFSVRNDDMTIARAGATKLKGLALEPDQYMIYHLSFPVDSSEKADLTKGMHFSGGVQFLSDSDEDFESDPNKQLTVSNDKISGPAYAKENTDSTNQSNPGLRMNENIYALDKEQDNRAD